MRNILFPCSNKIVIFDTARTNDPATDGIDVPEALGMCTFTVGNSLNLFARMNSSIFSKFWLALASEFLKYFLLNICNLTMIIIIIIKLLFF